MDFLLVFLISPKLVGTTYKTEQRENWALPSSLNIRASYLSCNVDMDLATILHVIMSGLLNGELGPCYLLVDTDFIAI